MDVYDPLSYDNLAKSVVAALMSRPAVALQSVEKAVGAGVYALYYVGDFPAYRSISSPGCGRPIYVGKAIPAGGRKGQVPLDHGGASLSRRLREHARSIERVENLDLSDFLSGYLAVVPVWISLAERFLVSHYRPVWNLVVEGFGDHDPGAGRRGTRRPRWDVLHPGRPWAMRLEPAETREEVLKAVEAFFAAHAFNSKAHS